LGWSYPYSCCSGVDCRQVSDKAISERPDGYVINGAGEVVAYSDSRVKNSPDGLYHWCSVAGANDGKTICLFVPPKGYKAFQRRRSRIATPATGVSPFSCGPQTNSSRIPRLGTSHESRIGTPSPLARRLFRGSRQRAGVIEPSGRQARRSDDGNARSLHHSG
jgi:hypothetical protein